MTSSRSLVSAVLAASLASLPGCSSDGDASNDLRADASGVNAAGNGSGGGGSAATEDATTGPTPGDDASEGGSVSNTAIGAQCSSDSECSLDPSGGIQATCLTEFLGGYCGLRDCQATTDCPAGSVCVAHDNGQNYCFRVCVDKLACNIRRSIAVEANCTANVTFVDPQDATKVCVPPASG